MKESTQTHPRCALKGHKKAWRREDYTFNGPTHFGTSVLWIKYCRRCKRDLEDPAWQNVVFDPEARLAINLPRRKDA